VIALPPSLAGAAKLTRSDTLRLETVPITGAPGTVPMNVDPDAADGELVPRPLVAVTVHV
jgi:hypothetical protein